ncbi:protein phosphatase 1 regulatory subunit 42-like [Rhopilema esculentum]|uniref:protein phosphatase 1 regulatory subunit 42-like n=1 Tax=Rhopilema esculentum TaxID=499914 RepID=UPI0031D83C8D
MVKITSELIIRHGSHSKKQNYENDFQFLRRLTHIYCQEKNIDEIVNLEVCKNLSVLYLYDNNIKLIKNLSSTSNLTHLYLQKNQLTRISGLNGLTRLSKLYLGSNSISVVEGLEKVESLSELHVENQHLPPGESLLFDPRTIESLSKSLTVLNVSGNNLTEVSELSPLGRITQFFASHNNLTDLYDLSCAVRSWPTLSKLELTGNPFCHKKKYRDKIILMSRRLVMLDGKEVNEATRLFLQSWQANKDMKRIKRKESRHDSETDGVADTEHGLPRLTMQASLESKGLTTEGSFVVRHPGPYSKQNKQFASLLAKASERKGIPLGTDTVTAR